MVDIDKVISCEIPWTCTNRHAILAHAEYIIDASKIENHIDWDAIGAKYWKDPNDPDLGARRQAEFLIRDKVPTEIFLSIGVMNKNAKYRVEASLPNGFMAKVEVKQDWYFLND